MLVDDLHVHHFVDTAIPIVCVGHGLCKLFMYFHIILANSHVATILCWVDEMEEYFIFRRTHISLLLQ
jgi:hypothetical protein